MSNLENGYAPIGPKLRIRLAKLFNCPPDEFIDDDVVREPASVYGEHSDYVEIPIMGTLPAGSPDDATASYRGKWEVRRNVLKGPPQNHIVVEARGDSMIGLGIFDGDMLTVRLQPDAEDGKVVAAYVEGDGVTCKRLRKKDGRAYLESANPERKPPSGPFKVIGVVVWREGKPW